MFTISPARRRRAVLLFALCASVSACASVPHTGPAKSSRADAITQQAHSLDGQATTWVSDGWWNRYADAQLSQLITEAVAQSPDLDAAAARIRIADGLTRQAGAALLPSATVLSTTGSTKISRNIGVPPEIVPGGWNDVGATGLDLTLDLDLWGKNRAGLKAAKQSSHAHARRVKPSGLQSSLPTPWCRKKRPPGSYFRLIARSRG